MNHKPASKEAMIIAGPVRATAPQPAGIGSVVYEPVLDTGFPTRNTESFNDTGKRLGGVPIGETLPDSTVTHALVTIVSGRIGVMVMAHISERGGTSWWCW